MRKKTREYHGKLIQKKRVKIGVVVARFNQFITQRLLDSALLAFEQCGVSLHNVYVAWVPGVLEASHAIQQLHRTKKCDAYLVLGCVIRGGTYHFECVAHEGTRGPIQVSLEIGRPVASGLITADTLEQAIDRAGLKSGNKGAQAALSLLEMVGLDRALQESRKIP